MLSKKKVINITRRKIPPPAAGGKVLGFFRVILHAKNFEIPKYPYPPPVPPYLFFLARSPQNLLQRKFFHDHLSSLKLQCKHT